MQNKQIVVTGATDGIGKVTARVLLEKGAKLALVARNSAKLEQVASELASITGREKPICFTADLSLPSQVKRVALEIREQLPVIHVLINNAGAYFADKQVNSEGFEATFALNHLNYFLMTHHLLPTIKKSAGGRIVNVSSDAHFGVDLDFANLQGEEKYKGWLAYQRSKLANVLFTRELAERLRGSGVTANSLHPGFVASKFGHNNHGIINALVRLGQAIMAITPEKGAETSIFLASSPEVAQVSGRYFASCREKECSRQAQNAETQKRLWQVTESLIGAYL